MLKTLTKILKNTSGSILPTFAVMTVPVFIIIGAAIDYTSYAQMRSEVQAALDAAALAATAELNDVRNRFPPEVDTVEEEKAFIEAELEQFTKDYLRANIDATIPDSAYSMTIEYIPPTSVTDPNAGSNNGNDNGDDNDDAALDVRANIEYDTIFGFPGDSDIEILSIDKINEELQSIVILGNRTVEIALVLDNSGSMGGNRISTLRTEATKLVNDVHNANGVSGRSGEPVRFSVVPFSGMVNVGPTNANASWMDVNGWSPSHHENLNWNWFIPSANDDYPHDDAALSSLTRGPVGNGYQINGRWMTRFDVFDMLDRGAEPGESVSWAGCVEMRPFPHNILDTVVDNSLSQTVLRNMNSGDFADVAAVPAHNANGNDHGGLAALFTPTFAPDEPDETYRDADFSSGNRRNDDDDYRNNYLNDFVDENGDPFILSTTKADNLLGPNNGDLFTGSRDQIFRTNWLFKYQNHKTRDNGGDTDEGYSKSNNSNYGPNGGCTTTPITPLTADRQTVLNAITALGARGTTNIQQGLTWGWRTLSPGLPFDEGRDKDAEKNLKFIVALTDGNNFYSTDGDSTPNRTAYGAWGYAREQNKLLNPITGDDSHNRWLDGLKSSDLADTLYSGRTFGGGTNQFDNTPESNNDFENIMNAHTAQACENIKDDGITIYAIAFEVPNTGGVRQLLERCAGSGRILVAEGTSNERLADLVQGGQFYYDVGTDTLDDAFESITSEIAALRLSK